jgi:hypothetical protein
VPVQPFTVKVLAEVPPVRLAVSMVFSVKALPKPVAVTESVLPLRL